MHFIGAYLVFLMLGGVNTRLAAPDINRFNQFPNELSPIYNPIHKRFIHKTLSNDNNRHPKLHPLMYVLPSMEKSMEPIKIHKPREDPRLFYQSESYLKEVKGLNVNHEVAQIYPGREVVRADEVYRRPMRLRKMIKSLSTDLDDPETCVRCPHDRTLVAKAGSDKVLLQNPRLMLCSGRTTDQVRWMHLYGPKFGSLLQQGSHIVAGKIILNGQVLKTCKIQVHVVLQSCPIPKSLKANCHYNTCNFTCRDSKQELQGSQSLTCGEDFNWNGFLPTCKTHNWCIPQPPPEHGKISCKGETYEQGPGLLEGSRCRVRCAIGWRAVRTLSTCRRGKWSHDLACQPRRT